MSDTHQHNIQGMMCRHIDEGSHSILQVIHHFDGMWEFSCSTEDHPELDDFVGLCLDCSMEKLTEYQLLKELKVGQWASRDSSNGSIWERHLLPPDEEDT